MTLAEAYSELEVELGAPKESVLQARKILLRVWHPDRHEHDPKLRTVAEKKTARINAAYDVIEGAGFPGPEVFESKSDDGNAHESDADERKAEQQIRLRELELREREIALQEQLAARPTTTEWIDKKASQVARGSIALALVALLVCIDFVVIVWLLQDHNLEKPMPLFLGVAVITASLLAAATRANRSDLARLAGMSGLTACLFIAIAATGVLGTDQGRLGLPAIALLGALGGLVFEPIRRRL